jgi:isoquinoline 1-oxidoreductase
LGGGIVVYISLGDAPALAQWGRRGVSDDFNAFLRIGIDGRVTCFTGKIEMGQGAMTALPQTLAEELEVPYESVDIIMGDTDLCPWDRGTHGSMTQRFFGPVLREAAAQAKAVLLELAAEHLGTNPGRLAVREGVVFDRDQTERNVSYASLTRGKIIEKRVERKPGVKKSSEFRLMGKSFPQRGLLEKVTGKAGYAGDVRLPGMLYARILRPPAHGARLKSLDTSGAEKIDGVRLVRDGDLIAVLHRHPDAAGKALAGIKAEFEASDSTLDDKNIFDHLIKVAPGGDPVSQGGNLEEGRKLAAETFQHRYLNSYVAHAPMETHTSTAAVEGGRVTVWAATQSPFGTKNRVAGALGISLDEVRVITPFVGGGFGGKNSNPEAVEAARLARLTGKPVQVAWSRAEEFFYDNFRPAAVVRINSGLDGNGRIVFWDYDVYFAGSSGADLFYDVPHHRELSRGHWMRSSGVHPFSVGPWRAPGNNTNTFAGESQMDIMAEKAGKDPLEFRLSHLTDPKMRRVLEAAAEKFGWTPSRPPSGRGFGVACGIRSGSYVATMAEVAVDKKTGRVRVKRMVCAQDMGLAVNPQGARLQMEGCLTMGLGYALTEEVRFRNGEILDLNFDTYEITRFSGLPEIDTVIIENRDSPPQGGGEPAIICVGAVVANGIYDAVGARLFQLPMTPERVKAALQEG